MFCLGETLVKVSQKLTLDKNQFQLHNKHSVPSICSGKIYYSITVLNSNIRTWKLSSNVDGLLLIQWISPPFIYALLNLSHLVWWVPHFDGMWEVEENTNSACSVCKQMQLEFTIKLLASLVHSFTFSVLQSHIVSQVSQMCFWGSLWGGNKEVELNSLFTIFRVLKWNGYQLVNKMN